MCFQQNQWNEENDCEAEGFINLGMLHPLSSKYLPINCIPTNTIRRTTEVELKLYLSRLTSQEIIIITLFEIDKSITTKLLGKFLHQFDSIFDVLRELQEQQKVLYDEEEQQEWENYVSFLI